MKRKQKSQNAWTTKEIQFIQDNNSKMTPQQLADKLGRTPSSIRSKIGQLGLKSSYKRDTLDYAYYNGDKLVCVGSIGEIEKFTGINRKHLFMYRLESYKNRLKRELIEIE